MDRELECTGCGRQFETPQGLGSHVRTCSSVSGGSAGLYTIARVQCSKCGQWFDTPQALGSHIFWKHEYRGADGRPRLRFSGTPRGSDGKAKVPPGIARMIRGEDSINMELVVAEPRRKRRV